MANLYYVDDQMDYIASLNSSLAIADPGSKLKFESYVGVNRAVERFMDAIQKSPLDPLDAFLLDINMPAPNRLKLARNVWPDGHAGDHQFCGIALAKWLVIKNPVASQQIAFITHWEILRVEHQEVAGKLNLTITNDNYFPKNDSIPLQRWLASKCKQEAFSGSER
jgi:hypothetical protein